MNEENQLKIDDNETVFGFNEIKEKHQIYKKEEIDSLFSNVQQQFDEEHKVFSGTADPTPDLGKDGDIYFQYE